MLDNSVLIDSSLNMGSFFYWLNGQDNHADSTIMEIVTIE